MSLDAYGNWYPDLPDGPALSTIGSNQVISGSGAPSDSDGANGDVYINTATGDLYVKSGDSWTLFSGGSGGAQILIDADNDPNGGGQLPTDLNSPAFYYQDSSDGPLNLWRWSVADQTWKPVITT